MYNICIIIYRIGATLFAHSRLARVRMLGIDFEIYLAANIGQILGKYWANIEHWDIFSCTELSRCLKENHQMCNS